MTTNKKNADNLLIISTFYWYPEPVLKSQNLHKYSKS